MGEFDLITRFFQRAAGPGGEAVMLGIGDDCALLRSPSPGQVLAVSTDMLIEGRHFFAGTDPAAVGHKALAVNLSDLAAMGAEPLAFTLAIALPAVDEGWLTSFCDGLFRLAHRFNCALVGGDTTRGGLALSITVIGQVPAAKALRRDRAQPEDEIWVSGALGGAALAVALRTRRRMVGGEIDEGAQRRLDWPEPRVELGQALRDLAHAAIDLSDGLAGDLRHVLEASSSGSPLGADLMAADIPLDPSLAALPPQEALLLALGGGDDYELLFTAPPWQHRAIRALCPSAAMVGRVRVGRGILMTGRDGRTAPLEESGFDHFPG